MSMKIQVRFGQVGHSQVFDSISSVDGLMARISHVDKSEITDQRLLCKTGLQLRIGDELDRGMLNSSVIGGVDSVSRNNNQIKKTDSVEGPPCVYVFNHRVLLKPINDTVSKQDEQWMADLEGIVKPRRAMNQTMIKQRLLYQPIESVIADSNSKHRLAALYDQVFRLMIAACALKDIAHQNRHLIELCQNQRNACDVLCQASVLAEKKLKKRYEAIEKLSSSRETVDNETALRQNSSFFSTQDSNTTVSRFGSQLLGAKQRLNKFNEKIVQEKRAAKERYQVPRAMVIGVDKNTDTANKKCELAIKCAQDVYKKACQTMQFGSIATEVNNIDANADLRRFEKELSSIDLQKYFIDLSRIHYAYQRIVRQIYFKYDDNIKIASEIRQQLKRIQSEINSQDVTTNRVLTDPGSSDSRTEAERRINFYKKLLGLQTKLTFMIAEETQLRQLYVSNKTGQALNHVEGCLLNNKCPKLHLNNYGTTDESLIQLMSISHTQDGIQSVLFGSEILELMNKAIGQIYGFIETRLDGPAQLKQLSQLLTRISDVFYAMYCSKVQEITNDSNNSQAQIKKQLVELKLQNQKSLYALEATRQAQCLQDERTATKIRQLQQLHESAIQQLEAKIGELNEQLVSSCGLSALDDQRRLRLKVEKQLGDCKSQLIKNMQSCDQLFTFVNETKETNEDLKSKLTEAELAIVELKETLNVKDMQRIHMASQLAQLRKKISKDGNNSRGFDSEGEEQLAELKSHNEYLNQEVDRLKTELNRIILREIDQVEVQTDSTVEQIKSHYTGITVEGQPKPGNLTLFIPFSPETYVAVACEGEKSLAMTDSYFILDTKPLAPRVRQLLTQFIQSFRDCSLLVVVRVEKILTGRISYVQGRIQYAFGFEDDVLTVKNYAPKIRALQ